MPSHHPHSVSPKCYNSKIAFKLLNRAARWLIKNAGLSLIILAIDIDHADFFLFLFVRFAWGICLHSIPKATYNLSSYGRERDLVTQELFQAVYNLILEQSQGVFPCGFGAIDPKTPVIWYDIDTLSCFLDRLVRKKWLWPRAILDPLESLRLVWWCLLPKSTDW